MTAPYTPQQNGVVERRNQTIVGMARSMLKAKRIPLKFWREAVNTAVYIINRVETRGVEGMTPYEAWHGRKPSVQHMRTFGCLIHVKTIAGHLRKLDDRSTLMVFIGYERGSKAYRAYDPVTKKVVITRDAIFEEEKSWDWSRDEQEQVRENTGIASNIFHMQDSEGGQREAVEREISNDENNSRNENNSRGENEINPYHAAYDGENDSLLNGDRQESDGEGDSDALLDGESQQRSSAQQTPVRWRNLSDIYRATEPIADLGFCMIGAEDQ